MGTGSIRPWQLAARRRQMSSPLREQKLLSQEKLAEMSGLSLRTIQRVRRMSSGMFWHGAPPVSRRQALTVEVICIGIGIAVLAASLLASKTYMATILRVSAAFCLVAGYGLSINIRIMDSWKGWPASETPWSKWWSYRPARTLRGTVLDYTYVVLVMALFSGLVFWLSN
jgi:transcriptional regulator with XRE-family HTH domain